MSASDVRIIPKRQRDIEELASQIVKEEPGMTTSRAVQLASSVIDDLDALERDWDMRSALAYAMRPRRTRTA